jgi:hypothetical protein
MENLDSQIHYCKCKKILRNIFKNVFGFWNLSLRIYLQSLQKVLERNIDCLWV